jgi:hypothetical protein
MGGAVAGLIFLLNRYDPIIVVLALEINVIDPIYFQVTKGVQRVDHFALPIAVNQRFLIN